MRFTSYSKDALRDRAAGRGESERRRTAARARGERTYKPVRPCEHHPEALRYVAGTGGVCVECERLAALRYRHRRKLRADLGDLY
jgi:hypothetical protein